MNSNHIPPINYIDYVTSEQRNLVEELICNYCNNLSIDPVICLGNINHDTTCDKYFCRACVTTHQSANRCSREYDELNSKYRTFLSRIKINCCQENISYPNLADHIKQCRLIKRICHIKNCDYYGSELELESHLLQDHSDLFKTTLDKMKELNCTIY